METYWRMQELKNGSPPRNMAEALASYPVYTPPRPQPALQVRPVPLTITPRRSGFPGVRNPGAFQTSTPVRTEEWATGYEPTRRRGRPFLAGALVLGLIGFAYARPVAVDYARSHWLEAPAVAQPVPSPRHRHHHHLHFHPRR